MFPKHMKFVHGWSNNKRGKLWWCIIYILYSFMSGDPTSEGQITRKSHWHFVKIKVKIKVKKSKKKSKIQTKNLEKKVTGRKFSSDLPLVEDLVLSRGLSYLYSYLGINLSKACFSVLVEMKLSRISSHFFSVSIIRFEVICFNWWLELCSWGLFEGSYFSQSWTLD